MGLLDDAIREHLELKRRHGADPGEIAHQERAALEPVFPEEAGETDGTEPLAEHEPVAEQPLAGSDEPADGDGVFEEPAPPEPDSAAAHPADLGTGDPSGTEHPSGEGGLADFSHAGQETAELDMSAVLDEDAQAAPGEIVAAPPRQRGDRAAAPAGEDGLDWQSPEGDAEQPPADVPGQERLSFE